MSTKTLQKRMDRIASVLNPKPRIIHCGNARDELIALLEAQMQGDETDESGWTQEDEALARQLDIILDHSLSDLQETYNIKLIP